MSDSQYTKTPSPSPSPSTTEIVDWVVDEAMRLYETRYGEKPTPADRAYARALAIEKLRDQGVVPALRLN